MKTNTPLPSTLLDSTISNVLILVLVALFVFFCQVPADATSASGGSITQDSNFVYHAYYSNGTFTVSSGGKIDVLVVAGGGGGGARGDKGGGGGGAGGLTYQTGVSVSPGVIDVTVGVGGGGGAGTRGNNGSNSVFSNFVAIGGGGGAYGPPGNGSILHSGLSGGSGGGASEGGVRGPGTLGQGFRGGDQLDIGSRAGGGGGAGGVGQNGNNDTASAGGGIGLLIGISGNPTWYAGGGAGGDNWNGGGGSTIGGGAGGGGGSGVAGLPNTGGGGGGGLVGHPSGGTGGSGLVLIRYVQCPTIPLSPTTLSNMTVGVAYNQTITASGGAAPYSFAITGGSLPDGLSFTNNGQMSGSPTTNGAYSFIITATDTNGCTGSQPYSFNVVMLPPNILVSPTSQTTPSGAGVTLVVAAEGTAPLSYQWRLNGTNVSGATSASYTIPAASYLDAGYYDVVVSNAAGFAVSAAASLALVDIRMYAGISVYGPLSANYSLQNINALSGTNWNVLTNVALPSQPYIYIDYNSSTNPGQFYRAVPQ